MEYSVPYGCKTHSIAYLRRQNPFGQFCKLKFIIAHQAHILSKKIDFSNPVVNPAKFHNFLEIFIISKKLQIFFQQIDIIKLCCLHHDTTFGNNISTFDDVQQAHQGSCNFKKKSSKICAIFFLCR